MKKRVKKSKDKNGKLRYYDTHNKKRLSNKEGAKLFVKENLQNISETGKRGLKLEELTKQERRSFSAQKRIRINGKFIDKDKEKAIKDKVLQIKGERIKRGAELTTIYGDLKVEDILDTYNISRWVDDKGKRSDKSQFNIRKTMSESLANDEKLTVLHNGAERYGLRAFEYLDLWEMERREEIEATGSRVIFRYEVKVGFDENRKKYIYIDLGKVYEIESDPK